MSFQVQDWVYKHAPYRAGVALSVLKALANRADEEGRAFPGLRLLMLDSGYSGRGVWRGLLVLTNDGVISRERLGGGRGMRAVWRIVMDVSKWTLSRATIASAALRAAERRAYEEHRRERGQKGVRLTGYRAPVTVTPLQCNLAERVTSCPPKGDKSDTKEGAHPYMNLHVNHNTPDGLQPEGTEPEERFNPKVAALFKELSATLARRAKAGV